MKTLKYEEVYRQAYRDLADARASIEWFLEKVYNVKRLHSALGYRPPVEFERSLHGGIYRSDVSSPLFTPRRPAFRSRRQGIAHAGKHMPCPSCAMSSGSLFLDGLLASIARLRFTGIIRLKLLPR
jgi:hypothetical protein